MPPVNQGDVVGQNIGVLFLNRREIAGASQSRCAVVDADLRQPADIRTVGNSRKSKLRGNVCVGIQLEAVRVDAVVSEAEFIDEVGSKDVSFAQRNGTKRIVLGAIGERAAIEF